MIYYTLNHLLPKGIHNKTCIAFTEPWSVQNFYQSYNRGSLHTGNGLHSNWFTLWLFFTPTRMTTRNFHILSVNPRPTSDLDLGYWAASLHIFVHFYNRTVCIVYEIVHFSSYLHIHQITWCTFVQCYIISQTDWNKKSIIVFLWPLQ